ncbi:MAG: SRPBCC family protein [candidate division Zixibacteria bacterium]|nr:SRPBCC family protein [candidate division Zixibacteria bacterium]
MPEASLEICFNLPLTSVWEFISDLKNIASCLRFVGGVEKTSDSLIWKVKVPMSITTRTSVLKPGVIQSEDKKTFSWRAKGEHIQWSGRFELEEMEEKKTRAKIKLEVTGFGPMAMIINPTAALQIKNQLKFFVEQLKKRLEELRDSSTPTGVSE